MVVTELALLRLIDNSQSIATLQPGLARIKSALERAAHHDFSFYHGKNKALLIVGSWNSVEHHTAFLLSATNQELLKLCEGRLDVDWMVHVDVDLTDIRSKRWVKLTAGPEEIFAEDRASNGSDNKDSIEAQDQRGRVWAATLGDENTRFAGFEIAWAQIGCNLQQQQDTDVGSFGLFEEIDIE